ncbi:hypothetical protein HK405_008958 [Cladochytrium tenue]|nr:hypothetical protein HK405_008958 [Cladochytrium tenue]
MIRRAARTAASVAARNAVRPRVAAAGFATKVVGSGSSSGSGGLQGGARGSAPATPIEFGPPSSLTASNLFGRDAATASTAGQAAGAAAALGGGKLVQRVAAGSVRVGDVLAAGPVAVINGAVFLWDAPQYGVGGPDEAALDARVDAARRSEGSVEMVVDNPASVFHGWTTDVLKLFEVVEPPPDLLVLGTGERVQVLPQFLRAYLHSLGIQVEVMSSRNAAFTYNLLLQEGRRVATALLPIIPTSARTGRPLVKIQVERTKVDPQGTAIEVDGPSSSAA